MQNRTAITSLIAGSSKRFFTEKHNDKPAVMKVIAYVDILTLTENTANNACV